MNQNDLSYQIDAYGISRLARETGISRSNLYGIKNGTIDPQLSTLKKILSCLNLELSIRFKEQSNLETLEHEEYLKWSLGFFGAPCMVEETFSKPPDINTLLIKTLQLGRQSGFIHTMLPVLIYKNFGRFDWELVLKTTEEREYLGYLLNLISYAKSDPEIAALYVKIYKEFPPKKMQNLIKSRKLKRFAKYRVDSVENKIAKTWKFKTLDTLESFETRFLKWT